MTLVIMIMSLVIIGRLAYYCGRLVEYVKLPSLIGMMIFGMLIGPAFFNLVPEDTLTLAPTLKDIALVAVLFIGGLGISLSQMKQIGRPAILLSIIPATLEGFTVALMAMLLLNFSFIQGAILGFIIAAVSPAVLIPSMIDLIHRRVGQDKAIHSMSEVISSSFERESPCSMLFVGGTGCGKTFLVKEYARIFHSKDSFIKLDMSEFSDSNSVSKIIGSPPGYVGYQDKNTVLEKVKLHPHSVLLLDEIEKAHPSILKLFLQVLDEGVMTTSYGDPVSFRNCIIFMTSNLGSSEKTIGFLEGKKSTALDTVKKFL